MEVGAVKAPTIQRSYSCKSLARPGGNITGFSAFEFSIGGKWLDLLKQMSPGLARVVVLMSPPEIDPQSKFWLRSVEAEAPSLGVEVMTHHLSTTSDLESTMERLSRQPDIGLIWPTGTFVTTHAKRVVDLATRYRLPAISAQ